jgi:hypothetical protein
MTPMTPMTVPINTRIVPSQLQALNNDIVAGLEELRGQQGALGRRRRRGMGAVGRAASPGHSLHPPHPAVLDIQTKEQAVHTLRQQLHELQATLATVEGELAAVGGDPALCAHRVSVSPSSSIPLPPPPHPPQQCTKKRECDDLIAQSEGAYMKIVESSAQLYEMMRQERHALSGGREGM